MKYIIQYKWDDENTYEYISNIKFSNHKITWHIAKNKKEAQRFSLKESLFTFSLAKNRFKYTIDFKILINE